MAEAMARLFGVSFIGNQIRIRTDTDRATQAVTFLFGPHLCEPSVADTVEIALLRASGRGGFELWLDGEVVVPWVDESDLEIALLQRAQYQLVVSERRRAIVHGAALIQKERGILMAAAAGSGKTTLTSWLLGHDHGFLSDELAAIDTGGAMEGFGRPLNIKPGSVELLSQCDWLRESFSHARVSGAVTLLPWARSPATDVRLALILFPRYREGARFAVEKLSPGRAAADLMACLMNARNLAKHGLSFATNLTASRPCFRITYSHMSDVSDWLASVRLEPYPA